MGVIAIGYDSFASFIVWEAQSPKFQFYSILMNSAIFVYLIILTMLALNMIVSVRFIRNRSCYHFGNLYLLSILWSLRVKAGNIKGTHCWLFINKMELYTNIKHLSKSITPVYRVCSSSTQVRLWHKLHLTKMLMLMGLVLAEMQAATTIATLTTFCHIQVCFCNSPSLPRSRFVVVIFCPLEPHSRRIQAYTQALRAAQEQAIKTIKKNCRCAEAHQIKNNVSNANLYGPLMEESTLPQNIPRRVFCPEKREYISLEFWASQRTALEKSIRGGKGNARRRWQRHILCARLNSDQQQQIAWLWWMF